MPEQHLLGDDGEQVVTVTHDNEQVAEVIVNDYDVNGNVIGQHKEVKL